MNYSPQSNKQYILYGASFNPPHIGHFYAIQQMLEDFDKVIVFPFPHKYQSGQVLSLPPLRNRIRMLELFFKEFFPKVADRLILANLSSELKHKDQTHEGTLHTYDYLCYLRTKVPENTKLNVCLGIDHKIVETPVQIPALRFHRYDDIAKEFGIYEIPDEENRFSSDKIRLLLAKPILYSDDATRKFLRRALGTSLSEYIAVNKLYLLPSVRSSLKR